MLGKVIGNYQITGELAQGGMGAVYRGRHRSLPREVVVKSILLSSFPAHAQDQLKTRFVREAYVQSQLDHQNIVRVYEFFTLAENYYLVMEFVDGMSLRDLIKRQGAIAPANAVPLFKQALAALDYAHNFNYVDESGARHAGIIHRDIKPANLLLDGMARLKITDFGIVKLAGERGMTRTGFNPGTAEYMSPEQIRGLEVDVRSDLYSLGVTFYEALTGRLPFPHSNTGSEYEVLKGHIELAPPPIAAVRPDTPPALSALVMRSLEKDPNARFQSAAEFLQALLDYEQSGGSMREEVARAASKTPQVTHSMTEVISYDTRPAPITATTPPRAARPSIATQVIEPAQAERGVAAQPRRYGLLVTGAIVALIVVRRRFHVFEAERRHERRYNLFHRTPYRAANCAANRSGRCAIEAGTRGRSAGTLRRRDQALQRIFAGERSGGGRRDDHCARRGVKEAARTVERRRTRNESAGLRSRQTRLLRSAEITSGIEAGAGWIGQGGIPSDRRPLNQNRQDWRA